MCHHNWSFHNPRSGLLKKAASGVPSLRRSKALASRRQVIVREAQRTSRYASPSPAFAGAMLQLRAGRSRLAALLDDLFEQPRFLLMFDRICQWQSAMERLLNYSTAPRSTIALAFVSIFVSSISLVAAAESPSEPHLKNIRQLTVDGKNAEAYFSSDGDKLIFQSTRDSDTHLQQDCYQMYVMDLDGTNIQRVSNGFGTTTCGYFFPGRRRVLLSSTHRKNLACPPKLAQVSQYRWPLHDFDIFSYRIDGQEPYRLTATPGYDAEATVSFKKKRIVFTSMRDGDLDLYSMDLNGAPCDTIDR